MRRLQKWSGQLWNTLKKQETRSFLGAAAAIALLYIGFALVGIGCPIKYLTGVSCAGCGMTRAWLAALRGDLPAAFRFHPLFLLVPIGGGIAVFKKKIPAKTYKTLLFTSAGLFGIVYLFRIMAGTDAIVVFSPRSGAVFRLMMRILQWGGI